MALRKEPQTFPWARSGRVTKERIVGMRIIWQARLLYVLRERAHVIYRDWQDTDVQEEDMTWMADNRYLVDLPELRTDEVPHY